MAPEDTVNLINSATALVKHAAAQMGTATYLANNHTISVQLECGKIVQKTIRDVQDPPKKQATKKTDSKAEPPATAAPTEEVSDWGSEDERRQYGLDNKRSRRAEQKRLRKVKDKEAVERVVIENTSKTRTQPSYSSTDAAVTSLVSAASGNTCKQAAVGYAHLPARSAAPSSLHSEPRETTEDHSSAPAATTKWQFWPVVNSSTASSLSTAPHRDTAEPRRSRPLKAKERSCTRATNEAVQSLLGAQHFRRSVKEEPRRKELKD